MPLPLASLIPAVGGILSQGINALVQGGYNKKQKQFAMQQYQLQRSDALSDWNMNNEYNSPLQQMQRLKAAGLNPNLVYGKGADATTPPPRSSETKMPNIQAPQFDAQSPLMSIYDTEIKKEQANNLRLAAENLSKDLAVKDSQIFSNLTAGANRQMDMTFKGRAMDYNVEARRLAVNQSLANISNTEAKTKFTLNEDNRQEQANTRAQQQQKPKLLLMAAELAYKTAGTQMTYQQMQESKSRIESMSKSNTIKDFEIQLNEMGFTKSDPVYMRLANKLAGYITGQNQFPTLKEIMFGKKVVPGNFMKGFNKKNSFSGTW